MLRVMSHVVRRAERVENRDVRIWTSVCDLEPTGRIVRGYPILCHFGSVLNLLADLVHVVELRLVTSGVCAPSPFIND